MVRFSLSLRGVLLVLCCWTGLAASTYSAGCSASAASGGGANETTRAVNVLIVVPAADRCAAQGCSAAGGEVERQQQITSAVELAAKKVNADRSCDVNLQISIEYSEVHIKI
jgi:hypothetical protein